METLSVRCNHCGAPLSVSAQTRFVTCQFCHSSLEVKRSESSIFTEEVARMAENTDKMAGSLDIIQLQNEIERLDREWTAGHPTSPHEEPFPARPSTTSSAMFGMAFSVFFALVCFGMAASMGSAGGGMFVLVPVGMGIFALVASGLGLAKSRYTDAAVRLQETRRAAQVRHYEEKRNELVSRLEAKRTNEPR